MIREVLEETGLCVIKDSIQEYGQVHRIQKGTKEDIFIQDNYYFLCCVKEDIEPGVISNICYAPSVVAKRINRLLPENAFEFIIISSNYIFRKPDNRIFDLALEKAELQPDEVWYIGDQYECDVKGALNTGLLPVWYIGAIDLPYTEDKNILTVKTWSEIKQYMEG